MLNFLTRDLIALDVETTGLNPKVDRIIQLGVDILKPDGTRTRGQQLFNPETSIPKEATDVHHITNEMVLDAPRFGEHARSISSSLKEADICGFNVDFDLRFLQEECRRCGIGLEYGFIVDSQLIWKMQEPRSLVSARKRFLNQENVEDDAHDALVDATNTLDILIEQFSLWTDLPRSIEETHKLTREKPPSGFVDMGMKIKWKGSVAVIAFGKRWMDVELTRVDRSYLEWMLRSEFHDHTKQIVRDALQGKFPKR